MTFEGQELYPDLETKATALCFSLVMDHPFVDGNKRVGHAAMETFLVLNGFELDAAIEESERTLLALAAGELSREQLSAWVRRHTRPLTKA
jgi:death-on-curing protein